MIFFGFVALKIALKFVVQRLRAIKEIRLDYIAFSDILYNYYNSLDDRLIVSLMKN